MKCFTPAKRNEIRFTDSEKAAKRSAVQICPTGLPRSAGLTPKNGTSVLRFQDIFLKHKLLAIGVIASLTVLLLLSGGSGLKLAVASAVVLYFAGSLFHHGSSLPIESPQVESESQQQLDYDRMIDQVAQCTWEGPQLDRVLDAMLLRLSENLELESSSMAIFDGPSQTLKVIAHSKGSVSISELDLKPGTLIPLAEAGLAKCKEGATVYFADALKTAAVLSGKLAHAGSRSLVCVPLMAKTDLLGILFVGRGDIEAFSNEDVQSLGLLGERLAPTVHHAKLYSELEHAYNELRHTQQAVMQRERFKALGQMASGIAHDMNNALSPIVGFSDLLIRKEPNLSSNGQKYLQHIRMAGENVTAIVTRLRSFYRRRDPQGALRSLDLNELIAEVVDATRPQWQVLPQSKQVVIQMATDLASEIPPLIASESEVREALTHLIVNAVEALPKGGNIIVSTRVSQFESLPGGGQQPAQLSVTVSDTGIGMNEETRKRCLEPFFTTTGRRGAGLGLAMVYGIMERHEGTVDVQSTPGQGSVFTLHFPLRKSVAAVQNATMPGNESEPMQILCIDDEPLLRELIKELLECDGHKVEVSDNGQNGIDSFRQAQAQGRPFDVVITDLGMPLLDGRQVAKILKTESPGTPVVMLTGWTNFVQENGAASAEVDGVVSKPPRAKDLLSTLKRVTPSRRCTTGPAKPVSLTYSKS